MAESASAKKVAATLVEARLRAQMCELPDQFDGRPKTEAEGYRIQEALQTLLCERKGCGFAGYKVGLVTKEMRLQCGGKERLGIDWPVYGGVLSEYAFHETVNVRLNQFARPSVECELAVRMKSDVPYRRDAPHDRASIASYVGACMAGIELVDFHMAFFDYSSPLAPLFIADNGSNWGCVVGKPIDDWRDLDLAELQGRMFQDGRLVASGKGETLQGHPFNVLAWLQNHLAGNGKTLRAGEIVMLGSVVPNYPVTSPCRIEVDWDVLGKASVQFS
jgi:2-keto-4-pentenoate hydratase